MFGVFSVQSRIGNSFDKLFIFFQATIYYAALGRKKLASHLAPHQDENDPDFSDLKRFGYEYLTTKWDIQEIQKAAVFFHQLETLRIFGQEKMKIMTRIRKEFDGIEDISQKESPRETPLEAPENP